ncbi:MAG: hypothetical protein Q9166_001297 [cf. Caloplaca sp. 2 TL-2023]
MVSSAKILAAGFNLHGQLESVLPEDTNGILDQFKEIQSLENVDLSSGSVVGCALWSATIIRTHNNLIHRGISGANPSWLDCAELFGSDGRPRNGTFFGDVSGVRGFLDNVSGELFMLPEKEKDDARFERPFFSADCFLARHRFRITHIAIAGNAKVCVATRTYDPGRSDSSPPSSPQIHVFPNLESLVLGANPVESFTLSEGIEALVASSTTFTVLSRQGHRVYTFGDARYPSLLGRTPSAQSPASCPTVVAALDGVSIARIATGKWLSAAVSCEKDLYVWGHILPATINLDHSYFHKLLNTVGEDGKSEDVHLVDVADGINIEDVAVGDEHIVVRTTSGELWGYGSNTFGQLNLGEGLKSTKGEWVKIYMSNEGERIREIAAGSLNTLLVVVNF